MLIIYRSLINLLLLISPIILILRILKGKEDSSRFFEKYGFTSLEKNRNNLIWFHGSSVGEILSVIPIIEKIEKEKKNIQILITSNTLSSSKVLKKYNFKRTFHQFLPIDSNIIVKKFLNHWEPNLVIFIESEIWPNYLNEVKNRKIPLILLNARITKRTYKNWMYFQKFAKDNFNKFDLCLSQNNETTFYLKRLGGKKIVKYGNLKFSTPNSRILKTLNKKTTNFFSMKKILFGGFSTHNTEEKFCVDIHLNLKNKFKRLLTIIVPRHTFRADEIVEELNRRKIKFHRHSSNNKIQKDTEIYIVDTFGETELFMKYCKIVFLGGSLINHGGQNPIEAARNGCKVIHGPNISNFKEVYKLLNNYNITKQIGSKNTTINLIRKAYSNRKNSKRIKLKLNSLGRTILIKNYNALNKYLR